MRGRKAEGYVYLISQFSLRITKEQELPVLRVNGREQSADPKSIFYFPDKYDYPSFVSIMAFDISSTKFAQTPNVITLVIENSYNLFVSESNIYLTHQNFNREEQSTQVHKVFYDKDRLIPRADGEVPGYIINQFSMDEFNDIFRIATTVGFGDKSSSGVYCLDEEMEIIGQVDGIAPTERIFSTRFIGDILYMVTFRQVDPFFTIDLSDHENPTTVSYTHLTLPTICSV